MGKTAISYATVAWPLTAGCTKMSPGCENCWACELTATRLDRLPTYHGLAYKTEQGRYQWTGEVRLLEKNLPQPLHWRKPQVVFVNSQSDLFHESVPFEFIDKVWQVMQEAHDLFGHIFLVLTKRPERILKALGPEGIGWYAAESPVPNPEPGIYLGVTAENQDEADHRIPILLQTPAAKRWVSIEPMLEPVDLSRLFQLPLSFSDALDHEKRSAHFFAPRLDWVVVGSESGRHARPMQADWVRSIRDQCQAAGVKFYFKQALAPKGVLVHPRDRKARTIIHHPFLDGRAWKQVPWNPQP